MSDLGRCIGLTGMTYCSHKAVRDGYCKQHHPDAVKARDAKRDAEWDQKSKARAEQRKQQDLRNARAELFPKLLQELEFEHGAYTDHDFGESDELCSPCIVILQAKALE